MGVIAARSEADRHPTPRRETVIRTGRWQARGAASALGGQWMEEGVE